MTTVPKPPDENQPASRRQLLAFIALADIPMPESIDFYDEYPTSVDIDPGNDRDLTPLLALFGEASRKIDRQRYDHGEHGRHGFILKVYGIQWRGWSISLRGFASDGKTTPVADELDAETCARLEQIADAAPVGPAQRAAEEPIPFDPGTGPVPGYVAGWCGHRVAESEWRAGFRVCERCPKPDAEDQS